MNRPINSGGIMSAISERAESYFREDFSCSQSVLAAYAPLYDLSPELAFRLASGFGGGMAGMGEVCGAVTGALMVIGLHAGNTAAQDSAAKEQTYSLVTEYVQRFKTLHGELHCRQLLGYEIGKPEERQAAREAGLFISLCPLLVRDSADILADLLGVTESSR
jgi:C_GCAxxG_C_C family probable redox protein